MRRVFFVVALAGLVVVGLDPGRASAWGQHTCHGHAPRAVAVAGYAPLTMAYGVSAPAMAYTSYAPVTSYHPVTSYVPVTSYAPVTGYAAAPSYAGAYGYAAGYGYAAPSYGYPYGATGYAAAPPMPRAEAPPMTATASGPADLDAAVAKLVVSVGMLRKIVDTHTDVLTEHQTALRSIHERTTALERRATTAPPPLPLPKGKATPMDD